MNEHAEGVSGENAVIGSQWQPLDSCASPSQSTFNQC